MPCKEWWHQIRLADETMANLKTLGISPDDPIFGQLTKIRGELFGKLGFRVPRNLFPILSLVGLSPGSLRLWYDVESGWLVEARERGGAPPVYRYVGDEVAAKISKDEITHAEFMAMLEPEEVYIA